MNKSKKKIVFLFSSIVLIVLISLFFGENKSRFNFHKFEIPNLASVDTIEVVKGRDICILGISVPRLLDNFDYYVVINKSTKGKSDILYKIDGKKSRIRVSKDYFAIVTFPESKWGWFCIKEGKIENKLPNINRFKDSLKKQYSDSSFIQDSDGYIRIYLNGKVIKSVNYGNLATRLKELNFDSLDYHVYKLQGDSLIVALDSTDSLFNQMNGVFFIPSPGYGVIKKCRKIDVFRVIDSVSVLKEQPNEISIDGSK
jgi:hypothetical protein